MSLLDSSIVIVYVLVILMVGFYYSKKIHNLPQYILAGRRLILPVALGTMVGANIGGGFTLGFAGQAYSSGPWIAFGAALGCGLGYLLLGIYGYKFREARVMTVGEYLGNHYGRAGLLVGGLITVGYTLGWIGLQYLGMGVILEAVFGIDRMVGSLIALAIVLIYTTSGGMWAITTTDFLQVTVQIIGFSILGVAALLAVNGFSGAYVFYPPEQLALAPVLPVALSVMAVYFFGDFAEATYVHRYAASKDVLTAKALGKLHPITSFLTQLFAVSLGILAVAVLYNDIVPEPDLVIPMLMMKLLPIGLVGIVFAALLAIYMSCADSLINTAVGGAVRDLYGGFINKNASNKKQLSVARWLTVIFGLASFAFPLLIPSVWGLMYRLYELYGPMMFLPVFVALVGLKVSSYSGSIGSIAGMATAILWLNFGTHLFPLMPVAVPGIIISGVVMAIVHFITKDIVPSKWFQPVGFRENEDGIEVLVNLESHNQG